MSSEDIATDVNQHQAEESIAPQERMISQSEVDKIVHAKIMREREKMQPQNQSGMGGIPPGFDEDALLARATERMQQELDKQRQTYELEQNKARVEDVVRNYEEKMKMGPELYSDFNDVMADYNPSAFPQVTLLAAQMDNLPDIMYELAKNPGKLTHLHTLALASPDMARKELVKLSESIKRNDDAVNNNVKSPSPLSKLKPSANAGSDTGKRKISDLRKMPWLRG